MLTREELEALQKSLLGQSKEKKRGLQLTVHISCSPTLFQSILQKNCTSISIKLEEKTP